MNVPCSLTVSRQLSRRPNRKFPECQEIWWFGDGRKLHRDLRCVLALLEVMSIYNRLCNVSLTPKEQNLFFDEDVFVSRWIGFCLFVSTQTEVSLFPLTPLFLPSRLPLMGPTH